MALSGGNVPFFSYAHTKTFSMLRTTKAVAAVQFSCARKKSINFSFYFSFLFLHIIITASGGKKKFFLFGKTQKK
jgi:hypothetical protein